jgi:hypothetical protein
MPNGLRYPRVGGRGQCLRCRKSPKPEKCLKIAQTPTRRVHALLGCVFISQALIMIHHAKIYLRDFQRLHLKTQT